jgi:hypothetical protein
MLADLDLLLTAVFCAADDLLPARPGNARRTLTDAEVVTLCVAQAIMGIPTDEPFLKAAPKRLKHLFPRLPNRSGYYKRRDRLADTIQTGASACTACSPWTAPTRARCRRRRRSRLGCRRRRQSTDRALDDRNARERVLGRLRGGGRSRLDRVRARDDGHANLPALVEQSGAPDLPGGGRGLARGLRGDGERARSASRRRPLELAGDGLRRGKPNAGNAHRRERRVTVARGQPERARRRDHVGDKTATVSRWTSIC